MKTNRTLAGWLMLAALFTLNLQLPTAFAQGTAFSYQGRLNDGAGPATGLYDFRFAVYDDANAGGIQSTPVLVTLGVTNGLFTTTLNFGGNVFNGSARWLEINVRTNGAVDYATLAPRQPVTPAPYAIYAAAAGGVNAAAITGTLAPAQLPDGTLTNNAGGVTLSGSFTGSGGSLTGVNAATLNGLGAGGFWQLGGNNISAGQFLGSTNNQPVEIWAGGQRALRLEPTANDTYHSNIVNVVGGSSVNFIAPGVYGSVIVGGGAGNYYSSSYSNSVSADISFLGGGIANSIQTDSYMSFLGGGSGNSIQTNSYLSFLGGGANNSIQTNSGWSFLGGGAGNSIQPNASASFLGGGYENSIQPNAWDSVLGGGYANSIQTNDVGSFLGGGANNSIQPYVIESFLGGGEENSIQSEASLSFLGGGEYNTNGAPLSVVPGGDQNFAGGMNSFAAGHRAKANYAGDFVWADSQDADFNATATNQFSVRAAGGAQFVTGGAGLSVDGAPVLTSGNGLTIQTNVDGRPNIIGGSSVNYIASGVEGSMIGGGGYISGSNSISANNSFLGGGGGNSIQTDADDSFLGGGAGNSIQPNAPGSFLGGGGGNSIQSEASVSFLGGGEGNTIQWGSDHSFLGGGGDNTIQTNAGASVLGGGWDNQVLAYAPYSSLGGGLHNRVGGAGGTVPGGNGNGANGVNSFAAGTQAKANYAGDFVWADSQDADFNSTATNQFSVRAAGGAQFVTGGAGLTVDGAPVLTSGGGSGLTIQQNAGTGAPNIIGGSPVNYIASGVEGSTIAGGGATNYLGLNGPETNSVSANYSFLGGGMANSIQSEAISSFLGGGENNSIQTNAGYSVLVGGVGNSIQSEAYSSFLGGGSDNSIQTNASYSFLGGGEMNSIQTYAGHSFLGGGYGNSVQTNAIYSVLGGGMENTIGAPYSVVPGGNFNYSGGANSFAAGHRAKANYAGDFVWADTQDADFNSTATNQFSVRAAGGAQFVTGGAGVSVDGLPVLTGNSAGVLPIAKGGLGFAPGVLSAGQYLRSSGAGAWSVNSIQAGDLPSLSATYVDLSSGQTIGGTKNFSGLVGIGISPSFALDVNGRMALRGSSSGVNAGLWLYDSAATSHTSRALLGMDGTAYFGVWGDMGAGWGMVMNVTNGYVGIGTGTPDALLTVNGTVDKPGGGSWNTLSDGRLKDVGAKFTHGLADLARLQPVHYHYKADNPLNLPSQPEYVGVVAQQVQPAIPEAVQPNKDGYLTVNNDPIIWTMVNAIKELNQKVEDKNAENGELKAQNQALEARLEKLEQLVTEKIGGGQ